MYRQIGVEVDQPVPKAFRRRMLLCQDGAESHRQPNARHKSHVADRNLEIEVMRQIATNVLGLPVCFKAVLYAEGNGVSLPRICACVCDFAYRTRCSELSPPATQLRCAAYGCT